MPLEGEDSRFGPIRSTSTEQEVPLERAKGLCPIDGEGRRLALAV